MDGAHRLASAASGAGPRQSVLAAAARGCYLEGTLPGGPRGPEPQPPVRPLLLLLAASIGFASVSTALRRLVPWPDDQGLWVKWEYFKAHKDEFDAVWIGSSLVLRDIDVRAIDAGLAAGGAELRSFNFGVGGMGPYEQDFLLHRLLELEPARLRYVFYEGGPVGLGTHPRHVFQTPGDTDTFRSVFWHDASQTGKLLKQVRVLPVELLRKLDLGFTHVRVFGRKLASYGLGPEVPRHFEGPEAPTPMLTRDGGFRPYAERHGPDFVDAQAFGELVAAIPEEHGRELVLAQINTAVHAAQYAAAKARGVDLVYVNLPASIGTPERPFLHRLGVIPWLLDFNRPLEYPELFRFEHHWDVDHLNRDGVAYLTPLLVERVLGHLARPPGSRP